MHLSPNAMQAWTSVCRCVCAHACVHVQERDRDTEKKNTDAAELEVLLQSWVYNRIVSSGFYSDSQRGMRFQAACFWIPPKMFLRTNLRFQTYND